MARVTEAEVRAIIDTDPDIDISAFITNAGVLTDRVETNAPGSGTAKINSSELKLIEMYLAAHFYALYDPQAETRRASRSSTRYQGKFGVGLEATYWGQTAMSFDHTGFLMGVANPEAAESNKKIELAWLGTTET